MFVILSRIKYTIQMALSDQIWHRTGPDITEPLTYFILRHRPIHFKKVFFLFFNWKGYNQIIQPLTSIGQDINSGILCLFDFCNFGADGCLFASFWTNSDGHQSLTTIAFKSERDESCYFQTIAYLFIQIKKNH